MSNIVDVEIDIEGKSTLFFDKKELKAAIRKGGALVLKESRRLIANKAISSAGQFPGYDTGAMSKSIKIKIASNGGYARVMPYMTSQMADNSKSKKYSGGVFYPAVLMYGNNRNGLKPRKDFMVQALDNKQSEIRAAIRASLRNALQAG